MTTNKTAGLDQPYKFLDYYGVEDRPIFFGRELETEILLSDIIATRLVVLFARTGTGKTSLINAGVRPRLEELDYVTFYVRVEQDPTESVRKDLKERDLLPDRLAGASLGSQLKYAVDKLERPIVVFFDQFEEFFIYVAGQDPDRTQEFISEIGELYRDPDSGVHAVFSMREEFFVEMDAFRDEIPSIFHNDSNLRLRWFDKAQAQAAIVRPAQVFGVEIEEALVERLITDLGEVGGVEPARLQIVCDTLWTRASDSRIRLSDYEELGGAEQILKRRLEEDIEESLNDEELNLFERLLPELTTERGTKYVRGVGELAKTLHTDLTSMNGLVERLNELGVIRLIMRHGEVYIEWTSDYLAERTEDLERSVKSVSLGRLLGQAMERAAEAEQAEREGKAPASEKQLEARFMTGEEFETISQGADYLGDLEREQAEFLLVAALQHGDHMPLWFEVAERTGVAAWDVLTDRIRDRSARVEQSENAVRLLGELGTQDESKREALARLELAMGEDTLSSLTIDVLGEMRTPEAYQLLGQALEQEALAGQVIDVLRLAREPEAIQLLGKTLERDDVFALKTGSALYGIAYGRPGQAADHARAVLAEALERRAAALFRLALENGRDVHFWFDRAAEYGGRAWEILRAAVDEGDDQAAANALRLLGELPSEDALGPLELALERDDLASLAAGALEQLASADQEKLATQAKSMLDKWREEGPEPQVSEDSSAAWAVTYKAPEGGLGDSDWAILMRRIESGKCMPILGWGATGGALPTKPEMARELAAKYAYPLADANDLARVAQYLAVEYDPLYPRDQILEEYYRDVDSPDFEKPDGPHPVLAKLPLPVYLTATYDDFMERALLAQGKEPRRELYRWSQYGKGKYSYVESDLDFEPTPTSPLVYHLYGHYESPESMVLSEDDYLNFLVSVSRDPDRIPVRVRQALADSSLLLIGHDLADWSFRALMEGLLKPAESSFRRISVVQVPPPEPGGAFQSTSAEAVSYLERYFDTIHMRVYWGTAQQFTAELRQRLEESSYGL